LKVRQRRRIRRTSDPSPLLTNRQERLRSRLDLDGVDGWSGSTVICSWPTTFVVGGQSGSWFQETLRLSHEHRVPMDAGERINAIAFIGRTDIQMKRRRLPVALSGPWQCSANRRDIRQRGLSSSFKLLPYTGVNLSGSLAMSSQNKFLAEISGDDGHHGSVPGALSHAGRCQHSSR